MIGWLRWHRDGEPVLGVRYFSPKVNWDRRQPTRNHITKVRAMEIGRMDGELKPRVPSSST